MVPSTQNEAEIARQIDARASDETLSPSSVAVIVSTLDFSLSRSEIKFLIAYLTWRRQNPIRSEVPQK